MKRDSVANGDDFGTEFTFTLDSSLSVNELIRFVRYNFLTSNLWMAKYLVYFGFFSDRIDIPLLLIDTSLGKVDILSDYIDKYGLPPFLYFAYITPWREKQMNYQFEIKKSINI